MINFNQIDVLISGSGVLAQSASIDSSNSLTPIYSIGKYNPCNHSPNGAIKNNFSISYIPETSNEINYNIVSYLRTLANDVIHSGIQVVIGGVTGYNCYLNSYSLRVAPNEILNVSVNYSSFQEISGNLNQKQNTTYNAKDFIPYGFSTFILNSGDASNLPVFDFSYDFSANWEPIYKVGQKTPTQVNLMSASESLSFTRDTLTKIQFSGQKLNEGYFTINGNDTTIDIYNWQVYCSGTGSFTPLIFDISGAKINNIQLSAQINDIVRVKTTAQKFY